VHVSGLWIYPVKSCRGIPLESIELDDCGFTGDRRFLIVDAEGKAVTQRAVPTLARIEAQLGRDSLSLQCSGHGSIQVPRHSDNAPTAVVEIWGDQNLTADDCGAEAALWLSDLLSTSVRLVRAGSRFHRPARHHPDAAIGFADAYPLLVTTEASLRHLNERLAARHEQPVSMERFRPNLIIADTPAHAEDTWTRLRIGTVDLHAATRCVRCVMITTDQTSGQRGIEPLRTLATYRRDSDRPQDVTFGRNLINESKRGVLRLGQPVLAA
jgi:uncharacterized protein